MNWTFLGHALTIVIAVGASFAYFVNPLRDDVRDIMHPQTGYPAAVRQGVADALEAAIREDKVVKLEIETKVDDEFKELIEKNNEVIADLRAEMATNRESLTTAIEGQTKVLAGAIGQLQGEMSRVRSTQNILLQRLGVEVPDDPNSYWKNGLWKDAPYTVAPIWIIDRNDYDLSSQDDLKKIYFRLEQFKDTRQ